MMMSFFVSSYSSSSFFFLFLNIEEQSKQYDRKQLHSATLQNEQTKTRYRMGAAVVRGIQSQGVVANAKHWVNNNQETDRMTVVEGVDGGWRGSTAHAHATTIHKRLFLPQVRS